MSFGKIYAYEANPRTVGLLAIAKENKLNIELVETNPMQGPVSIDYKKLNKIGRVPTFVKSDGFILSECMAIAIYFASQNESTTLLGKTKEDYASILRWMSYVNTDVFMAFTSLIKPLMGFGHYNKKTHDEANKTLDETMQTFEDHLMINTYLVGERVTVADIMCASLFTGPFRRIWDAPWRQEHPCTTRWFETISNQSIFKGVVPKMELCEERAKYTPPAAAPKEAKKDVKKEAPKPKAKKEVDEEEDDDRPEEPKAKHPIELLGKPTLPIDEWKRKFKNEETREVALPWFWENMKWDEYSIWEVDYKYNDELTMVFMTSNLVGGFFTRLEGSRKYIQGCASVFGVANDSVIKGAFVVRGQDATPAFDVAPDYESYDFKKLDPKSEKDRQFFDSMMAWDKPVEVKGKSYEWADGKIFV